MCQKWNRYTYYAIPGRKSQPFPARGKWKDLPEVVPYYARDGPANPRTALVEVRSGTHPNIVAIGVTPVPREKILNVE